MLIRSESFPLASADPGAACKQGDATPPAAVGLRCPVIDGLFLVSTGHSASGVPSIAGSARYAGAKLGGLRPSVFRWYRCLGRTGPYRPSRAAADGPVPGAQTGNALAIPARLSRRVMSGVAVLVLSVSALNSSCPMPWLAILWSLSHPLPARNPVRWRVPSPRRPLEAHIKLQEFAK